MNIPEVRLIGKLNMRLARILVLALLPLLCTAALLAGCTAKVVPMPAVRAATPIPPFRVAVAASEVVVGPNRLLLGISDGQGVPVVNAKAHVRLFPPLSTDTKPIAEAEAIYLGDDRGAAKALYSARASFDRPGDWKMEVVLTRSGQVAVTVPATVSVTSTGYAPALGQAFPPSQNPTSKDVPLEQLTSQRPVGDPDFYTLTIADALKQGRPLMVVVSAPAFCQTQTCGPQLEEAQTLKKKYGDRMGFVHIETFQRPDLLLEGKDSPKVNPVLFDLKVQTDPWVFIVDATGKVYDRFEGYAPASELEAALVRLFEGH